MLCSLQISLFCLAVPMCVHVLSVARTMPGLKLPVGGCLGAVTHTGLGFRR